MYAILMHLQFSHRPVHSIYNVAAPEWPKPFGCSGIFFTVLEIPSRDFSFRVFFQIAQAKTYFLFTNGIANNAQNNKV